MNIRKEWLNTDYTSQFYSAEETILEVKDNFNIRRYYSAEGADVIVDGITCRALIQYFTNPLNQAKYDRKLHVPMEININTGSLIDYDGFKWLVTGNVDDIQAYKSAGMVKCSNNTLNFYDQSHILHQIPCIINSNINLDTDQTTYIESPSTTIILKISNNEITRQIKRGEIYKLGIQNYEIKDINDIVEPGILKMEIEYSQEEQIEHIYTISILNGNSVDIQESTTLQLNINVLDNGTLISPTPPLTFTSSNETVCTISSNGLITALNNVNNCLITVSLTSDSSVSDTINIIVIEMPQDNYTYSLTSTSLPLPDTEIIINQTKQYEIIKYNNGILIEQGFTFSVVGDNLSYQLIVINGNSCSIKALKNGYTIVLKAVDNSNGEFVEKSIRLKNLF